MISIVCIRSSSFKTYILDFLHLNFSVLQYRPNNTHTNWQQHLHFDGQGFFLGANVCIHPKYWVLYRPHSNHLRLDKLLWMIQIENLPDKGDLFHSHGKLHIILLIYILFKTDYSTLFIVFSSFPFCLKKSKQNLHFFFKFSFQLT